MYLYIIPCIYVYVFRYFICIPLVRIIHHIERLLNNYITYTYNDIKQRIKEPMWWLWVCTTCTGIRDLNIFNRYVVKWLFLVLLYVPYRYYYYYGISYCSIASYKYHSNSSNNEGLVADYCVNDYISRYNNITNANTTCNSIMDMEYIDDHDNNHTNVINYSFIIN